MELQEQTTETRVNPFLQSHSGLIRIWHWLTFIVIALIIITVLLNSTVMNPRKNAAPVQNQLKEQGITIDDRQAFFVAHHFDDQLWDLHKILGIGLSVLLLLRIVSEFLIPADERIRLRLKSALTGYRAKGDDMKDQRHYLIVRISYTLFYLLLAIIVLTGLSMVFGGQLGISRELNHSLREFHGACQWVMYAFVLLHIGGVILADLGKAKGVVSGMINGNHK
jgi:Ni/Fe-hydrogenase 1 B-type cytochrome subunit